MPRSIDIALIIAALIAPLVLLTACAVNPTGHDFSGRSEPSPASDESPTFAAADSNRRDWVVADGGRLAMRVWVEKSELEGDDPIVLVAELANRGDGASPVIKPFGDWYFAESVGVALSGPNGPVNYTGPTPDYVVGSMSFLWLEPGESFVDRLTLRTENFAGSEQAGDYSVRYTYRYSGEWHYVDGAESAWEGEIISNPIPVTRR